MTRDYQYNWMYNWYNSRKDQLYNNAIQSDIPFLLRDVSSMYKTIFKNKNDVANDEIKRMFGNLNSTKEYGFGRKGLYNPSKVKNLLVRDLSLTSRNGIDWSKYDTNTLMDYNSYLHEATTFPGGSIIYYKPPSNDVVVHERTHALNASNQKNNIEHYFYKDNNKINNHYYDDSNEIYSRLMQFRYSNNLNPKQKITKSMIESWKKNKNIKDFNLLNRYNTNFLLHLFNDIALNDMPNEDKNYNA